MLYRKRLPLFVVSLSLLFWQLLRIIHQARHKKLYVRIEDNGIVKIGTCKQCVVHEKGRPARASSANGDAELDFPRDRLIQRLTAFGLQVEIEQEYVCP